MKTLFMLVQANTSNELMPGVYRVAAILHKDEADLYEKYPFQFEITDPPMRRIVPEREYMCPPVEKGAPVRGRFIKGIFLGFCYTDGCLEEENPTSIEAVSEYLEKLVQIQIQKLKNSGSE